MPDSPSDLRIRPIVDAAELDLFLTLTYVLDVELADDLASGRRRPEWLWVALRDGRVVARAAWWGNGDDIEPSVLDVLDVAEDADRVDVGVDLRKTALSELFPAGTNPPDYIRFIPTDWLEHPGSRQIVEERMAIAARTGAQLLVERLRLEWRPGTPISPPNGRLAFRPVRDDAELVDLMTLVVDGTLDAHSQDDLTRMSRREAAIQHFDGELAHYQSPREWWRIATLADGQPIGFVIPARNDYHAIIAYLGVLPAHRGKGYVDEILAEGTRILAAQEVPRIRASTDLDNTPMAQAFLWAGWVNFERSINMTWDSGPWIWPPSPWRTRPGGGGPEFAFSYA